MTAHPDATPAAPNAAPEVGPETAYEAARLRWAQPGDAATLAELWRAARPEGTTDVAAMRDWLEHGGAMLLEDPAGQPLCALRWREEPGGWRVDRIATVPAARGQGYGRWLMTMVEAAAIRRNIPQLTLDLDRADLLPYYRRLGYRRAGETSAEATGGAPDDGAPLTLSKRVGGTWQVKGRADGQSRAAGSGGTA